MQRYIARRLLQAMAILVILSIVVFALLRIAPGADPARIKCGLMCTEERYQALRAEMGLDDSYVKQYSDWVGQVLTGSLGHDWNDTSVRSELAKRLPVTLELLVLTIAVTAGFGIPFGIISALYRNSMIDVFVRFTAVLGLAVPNFWLATLVLLIPQQFWNYAPPITESVNFFDDPVGNLQQFVPPAFVLGAVAAAGVMRLTRSAMIEVMLQDYIRTARSKGLRQFAVVSNHALKNSLIPVVTVIGLQLAGLFGGAVIVENVFNLQGIGNYFLGALLRKDFQVAQTLTLYVGAVVVLMNLAVDVAYAWIDPRIRLS
ncbi:MAG TPA: ABC transporter permease [Dehalococcoidia bacterium]|nr:ABC transporter permease [Dehalococcoidia bacterium]